MNQLLKKLPQEFLPQMSFLKVFLMFLNFVFCRRDAILTRSIISLGIVCGLLLPCCMMACYCCIKKRGELYLLRNGGNNSNSTQNRQINRVEMGQRNADPVERNMFQGLVSWASCLRFRHNATPVSGTQNPAYDPHDTQDSNV